MSANSEKTPEQRLLTALIQEPNRVLDIDGTIVRASDFSHEVARCIYSAIKSIAENDKTTGRAEPVDSVVLEQKISEQSNAYYQRCKGLVVKSIDVVCNGEKLGDRDFRTICGIVLRDSIRRRSHSLIEELRPKIDRIDSPAELLGMMEQEVFKFTSTATTSRDITVLGEDYKQYLARKAAEKQAGTLSIGIESPYAKYNQAIGGGFRDETLSVIAARSKAGKSWLALDIAHHVAVQGIPVLYMDTELANNYQSDRRCAQVTGVPIRKLETMDYVSKPEWVAAVNNATVAFQQHPIYYVDIKGWPIDRQISVIRRFFAKHVGHRKDGKYNKGLVILDYLKLMRPEEKGSDQEWETLGYRMTLLHDLMGEYNNPMLAFAQQNRAGLEEETEATIAGSDRIIWLCDNFSILGKIDEAEVILHVEEAKKHEAATGDKVDVPNTRLKVVACRHGPGTPGRSYISMYFDIRDPRLSHEQVSGKIVECSMRRTIDTQGTNP